MRPPNPLFLRSGRLAILLLASTSFVSGQRPTQNVEWRTYGADLASTRYLPLDQINANNFSKLKVAWRFKTDSLGPAPEFNFQSTPLMANGMLYSTGGTRRAVFALDAATGELKWVYSVDEGKRAEVSPRRLSGRGLTYWTDGRNERIVYVTIGYQLVELDAKTGRPVAAFGRDGVVDLKLDDDQKVDPIYGDLAFQSAPIVTKDVIVVGAALSTGNVPKSKRNEKGYVRGYDVRTGKRLWTFHTIPAPGEFGNDTWLNDSWAYTGNTQSWAQMSADEQLGYVYVPTAPPTNDNYGGDRPGNNVFGTSLVALDVKTGKRIWHYQIVHHDLWDWDLPCAPILADITVDGRTIKAIAQPTKQAFVYVFDRVTGQPVWPIEERPVPKGDVPGEWYAGMQPFPTKPPPFDRQGIGPDNLIDFTPELHEQALRIIANYKIGPLFTPPVVSKWEGPRATLILPSETGGANWMGGAIDPDTNLMYIFSESSIFPLGLVHDATKSDQAFIMGTASPPAGEARDSGLAVQGLPLVKPPYGRITAIDLNRGTIAWQIAHGETPDTVRNHPALKGLAIPRTGRPGRIGTLVTKTLVIAGEGGFFTLPDGRRGAMLRAYDKASGKEVGAVYMPAPETGSPMTYVFNREQYIVVAISGGTYSGELVAFKLPSPSSSP